MKIKMLNNETIEKIAAGEMIVRPASVVKELVENALDAGASRVDVYVEKGGKRRIRIVDDGCGIPYNEIPLAFTRHATSKITTIDDLMEVGTLGFRGEALASIAAVSRVSIRTIAQGEEIGSETFFEDGECVNQRVCPFDRGTDIDVTDLFYNVPARQKHMQKSKQEEGFIHNLMERMALSHPEVAIGFHDDGRRIFRTTGNGSLKDVIECLYSRAFFAGMRELDVENAPMKLTGYISDLTQTRGSRDRQIFFVNGRYVRNKGLTKSFEEAYSGYLMNHRHPAGIIFMELPGRMLDVNIHPAKTEIGILNESLVDILFRQGIRSVIRDMDLSVDLSVTLDDSENPEDPDAAEKSVGKGAGEEQEAFGNIPAAGIVVPSETEGGESRPGSDNPGGLDPDAVTAAPVESDGHQPLGADRQVLVQSQSTTKQSGEKAPFVSEAPAAFAAEEPAFSGNPSESKVRGMENSTTPLGKGEGHSGNEPLVTAKPPLPRIDFSGVRIVGQLFRTFILLEKGSEAILIDQHAAHEAFNFEALKKQFASQSAFPSQTLLVPQPVDVSRKIMARFGEWQEALEKDGFDCDPFGDTTIVVRSVPVVLGEPQPAELVELFIEKALSADRELDEKFIARIAMMSCKKSIKGNQDLSREEINRLLEDLTALDNPYTCPHGRPIILRLKAYDLEKLFKRVV